MILCQKPVSSLPLHRRLPSAPPPVVVHPTCTPGLLSLAKPARPSPARQHQHQQSQRQARTPRSKPAPQPPNRSSHPSLSAAAPADSVAVSADPALQLAQAATPVSTPDRNTRGRSQAKHHKDKSHKRNTSHSSVNGQVRRTNNRQPSPEQPVSSQAEDPIPSRLTHKHSRSASIRNNLKSNVNLFDPFVVSSSSDTDSSSESTLVKPISLQPAPQLLTPPIKPTSRRQPIPPFPSSPTPASRTIPVPRSNHRVFQNISRSDPVLSHMPARSKPLVVEWDSFPVCNDMTLDDEPPSTPTRSGWDALSHSAPRSAPLSGRSGFPTTFLPSPPESPSRPRYHRRTPSDGVFNMSLDEDSFSNTADDLNTLFASLSKRRSPANNARANKDKAGYFASSMFQNSPSPDELPPPSFRQLA